MKPLSKPADNLEQTEKCSETLKENDKVDINALFESENCKSSTPTEAKSASGTLKRAVEQYDVENEANREQRHALLNKIRLTRGLSLVLAFVVTLFLLGLILTITSTIYLQNDIDQSQSNHKHNLQPYSSKIISDKIDTNSTKNSTSNRKVIDLYIDVPDRAQEFDDQLSNDDSESTSVISNDHSIEDQFLEELVPDSATNGMIKGLMNGMQTVQNDYRLEDLPPTIMDIMKYIRRIFHLPRVRFDYDD